MSKITWLFLRVFFNSAYFGVSEVSFFTKSTDCKALFEYLQRCATSRWLSAGSYHNRNNKFLMWPDNVLTVLRWNYRNYVCGIKHVLLIIIIKLVCPSIWTIFLFHVSPLKARNWQSWPFYTDQMKTLRPIWISYSNDLTVIESHIPLLDSLHL